MSRSKLLLLVIAFVIAAIVVTGTGIGAISALALRSGAPQALVRTVVRDLAGTGAAIPTPRPVTFAPQAAATPAATAPARAVGSAAGPVSDDESQILTAVYEKVNASVVTVYNITAAGSRFSGATADVPQGEGSGFVWDTQGHIVTNDHVVRGADKLQVVFSDGTQVDATLVGTDPNGDIAVIQVDPSQSPALVPVEVGDSSQLKVGETAIAIGNPFGLQGTMTRGIVSAVGRTIPAVTSFSIPEAIQTDAAINPGNSGGPLLNVNGQVIGVNDQIQSSSGSNSGVGFAIPINIVKRIAASIVQTGKYQHSYLGIQGGTYSKSWAQALGLPATAKGAYVMDVVSGGPAAQAGLKSGNQDTKVALGADQNGPVYLQSGGDLITAVDGHAVTKMDDLLIYLEENTSPGQTVTLSVLRSGGQQGTVSVTLGARPEQVQSTTGG